MKAVIIIKGGIVTSMLVDNMSIEVKIIDHDTEDLNPAELTTVPNIGPVYVYTGDVVEFAPNRVEDIFEVLSAQGPIEDRDL